MADLLAAHRKFILAALTSLLVQFVDQETADWIIVAVGLFLTWYVDNDKRAVYRLYSK